MSENANAPGGLEVLAESEAPCVEQKLLRPGETCWKIADAARVRFLVDAATYLGTLREALKQAKDYVYIVGWDVDTRTPLHGDPPPQDGWPLLLLDFLNQLLRQNRRLRVYILSWDFAVFYVAEREWFPAYRFSWKGHRRLKFALDGAHPMWASHHQKMVVIDDKVAFVGGIDLGIRRWDTSAHAPQNPMRLDPGGVPYPPVHDVQVGVEGPVARDLGCLFRARWMAATGRRIAQPSGVAKVALDGSDLSDVQVAIARTQTHETDTCIREVEALVVEAISRAQKYIYIENQYLTSGVVGSALAKRLLEPHGPEVVAVLPHLEQGWLEQESLGVLRFRLLERLRRDDKHQRLQVMYPFVTSGETLVPIYVHSKVLLVDDEFLKIGSSNMTNRSLGLDTECDLVFVAEGEGATATSTAIRGLRNQLLGEHLGTTPEAFEAALTNGGGSLIGAIQSLSRPERGLVRLEVQPNPAFDFSIYDGLVCDPERPRTAEALLEATLPKVRRRVIRRSLVVYAAMAALLLAGVLAVKFTELGQLFKPQALAEASRGLLAQPGGVLLAAGIAVLALCLFVPVTVVIAAGALLLPAWQAFFVLYGTALTASAISFGLGKWLGVPPIGAFINRAADKLRKHLKKGGFLAVLVARLLPVGNFTAINLLAGAVGVPFLSYMMANAVGLLPGLVLLCLFSGRVAAVWNQPDPANVVAAVAALILLVGALAALRGLIRRRIRTNEKSKPGAV